MVKMSMEEKEIFRDEILFKLNSDDQRGYERIKEICELLDEGGTLEKIKELMKENHLRGDEYLKICVLLLRTYIGMPWAVSVRMYACGHLKPPKQSMGKCLNFSLTGQTLGLFWYK